MTKIVTLDHLPRLVEKLHAQNTSIVLTGGVFDILHQGHIEFLKLAKKAGDILIVLIESDENVKSKKGPTRPVNSQKHRCIILGTLKSVDYIIPLKNVTKNEEYDKLIVQIIPSVIALTQGDNDISRREKQADMVGAKLLIVNKIDTYSTSNLINKI